MYLEVYNHFLRLSILAALENGSLWNMAVYQPGPEILLLQASFKMLFVLKKKKKYPWKWANCILLLSDTSDKHFLRTHLVDLFSGNCLLNHYCHNMAYVFCWLGQRQKVTCKYFSECHIIILLPVTSTIHIFFLFFQILTAKWVSITFSPVRHGHWKRVLKRIIFIVLRDLPALQNSVLSSLYS